MTDRPIIFPAPMVRALLYGRKTQTRRVLKPQPPTGLMPECFAIAGEAQPIGARWSRGDRLWVREAHSIWADAESAAAAQCLEGADEPCIYRADYQDGTESEPMGGSGWRASIHMPRWASRLTLTVTDVRVQRLQEITLGDICAEGLAQSIYDFRPVQRGFDAFAALWNILHGPGAWDANPWVSAITFTVHRCNIDQMEAGHD